MLGAEGTPLLVFGVERSVKRNEQVVGERNAS